MEYVSLIAQKLSETIVVRAESLNVSNSRADIETTASLDTYACKDFTAAPDNVGKVSQQLKTKAFYDQTLLPPLSIYIENSQIDYMGRCGSHNREITQCFMRTDGKVGGCFIFLPFLVAAGCFRCLYNVIIAPFVWYRYYPNTPQHKFLVKLTLRRSNVVDQ